MKRTGVLPSIPGIALPPTSGKVPPVVTIERIGPRLFRLRASSEWVGYTPTRLTALDIIPRFNWRFAESGSELDVRESSRGDR